MNASSSTEIKAFEIKDCTLIALATGIRAQNLRELKEQLSYIQPDSIYYHFWRSLLRPRFDDPEYHNDFALWAAHDLHDPILAERLAVVDPSEFSSISELREELLEIMDERLDQIEYPLYSRQENQFEFIRSQIVIFNTKMQVKNRKSSEKFYQTFQQEVFSIILSMRGDGQIPILMICKTG